MPDHNDEIQEVIQELIDAIKRVVEGLNDTEERRKFIAASLRAAIPLLLASLRQRIADMILNGGGGMRVVSTEEDAEPRSTTGYYNLFSEGGKLDLQNTVSQLLYSDGQSRLNLTLLSNAVDVRTDEQVIADLGMPDTVDVAAFRSEIIVAQGSVARNTSGIDITILNGTLSPYSTFLAKIGV